MIDASGKLSWEETSGVQCLEAKEKKNTIRYVHRTGKKIIGE